MDEADDLRTQLYQFISLKAHQLNEEYELISLQMMELGNQLERQLPRERNVEKLQEHYCLSLRKERLFGQMTAFATVCKKMDSDAVE
jgi:hypothetical protein